MTEEIKKTAEAHKTLSEEIAMKKAGKTEETTKEMIKEIEKKEEKEIIKEKGKKIKEIEKKEEKNKKVEQRKNKETEKLNELRESWEPKTKLGKDVKSGKIKNIDEILDQNKKILEEGIVDYLLDLKSDLILMGQAKGKFGGGKRRAWRQTQRKKKEGNALTFSAMAVVGDENGHFGIGVGEASETLPARDKAIRKAKLNLIKIKRDCAAFDCACSEPHTIPYEILGKCGSVKVILIPAPQGTGLVVANELKKILKMAGIQDIYSKTFGRKRTTFNLIKACVKALKKTNVSKENKK